MQNTERELMIPDNLLREKVFKIPPLIEEIWQSGPGFNLSKPVKIGTKLFYPLSDVQKLLGEISQAAEESAG